MSVELSKQKLALDTVERALNDQVQSINQDRKILIAGIQAIDKEGRDMLNEHSVLAQEVRAIMKNYSSILNH